MYFFRGEKRAIFVSTKKEMIETRYNPMKEKGHQRMSSILVCR